jgi:hypothetical protein
MRSGKQRKTAVKNSDAPSMPTTAKGNRAGRAHAASRSGQTEKLSVTPESSSQSLERVSHRPSVFRSEELVAHILSEVAQGVPLVRICKRDDMPSLQGFYNWLSTDASLVERYARAKEDEAADALADEIISIADMRGWTRELVRFA